jgi:peptidoglycan hydrolase CwlO-like protein
LSLGFEQYFSAVKRFHQSVSDLVDKLEEINDARAEVLKASREIRAELDITDKQIQETAGAVREQMSSLELPKKAPQSDETVPPLWRAG